jgi:transcriptional regulator with XRE-family HTH domain
MDVSALKNFRSNLNAVCEQRGVSQRALAERAGLHWTGVNRILQGHTDPSLSTCERLAEAVEVPLEDMLAHPVDFKKKILPVHA